LAFGKKSYTSSYVVLAAGLPAIVGALFPGWFPAMSPAPPNDTASSALKHPNNIGPANIARIMFRIRFPLFRRAGYTPKLYSLNFTMRKRHAATGSQERIA
jgi:hypothetical protein